MIPSYVKENWKHFRPIVAKDMAHCRGGATGCLANYALLDANRNLHVALIGSVLDTESFRSWHAVDSFLLEHIPALDAQASVVTGDGQKGELKSHKANFKNAILRACSRHRSQELAKGAGGGKVGKSANANVYRFIVLNCTTPRTVARQRTSDAYMNCVYMREEAGVKRALDRLKTGGSSEKEAEVRAKIHERLTRLPLEVQFPACAIAAGHGAPCGQTTSNNAEVSRAVVAVDD